MDDIENDLDKQFGEKLTAAIKHTTAMYEIAGLRRVNAAAAIAAQCLIVAAGIFAASRMSKEYFVEEAGKEYDRIKAMQCMK